MMSVYNRVRILISCPDKLGIVAAVGQFLFEHKANIIHSDQYSSPDEDGLFFMRVEFEIENYSQQSAQFAKDFHMVAEKFLMEWQIHDVSRRKRMAIFVSKEDHCLRELLWEWETGHLYADIAMVISNHDDARDVVTRLGIPFHYVSVDTADKSASEQIQLNLLENQVDFIVLARYMQILSATFVERYRDRIINIHHSFLPAFIGRNPYQRAYNRGVKLIGATAHYVTADLDEGPIIEQGVHRVDHRHSVADLKRIGRQVERAVLAQAVKWHLEDRVIIHGNKTIVFS